MKPILRILVVCVVVLGIAGGLIWGFRSGRSEQAAEGKATLPSKHPHALRQKAARRSSPSRAGTARQRHCGHNARCGQTQCGNTGHRGRLAIAAPSGSQDELQRRADGYCQSSGRGECVAGRV